MKVYLTGEQSDEKHYENQGTHTQKESPHILGEQVHATANSEYLTFVILANLRRCPSTGMTSSGNAAE